MESKTANVCNVADKMNITLTQLIMELMEMNVFVNGKDEIGPQQILQLCDKHGVNFTLLWQKL